MEFQSNRSKGLNAYIAPVKPNGEGDLLKANYGQPKTDADKAKAHRSKRHTVVVDQSTLSDGFYVWKEAGGADFNKARYGWLEVRSGEVVQEWESQTEFRNAFNAAKV
jgi:hypothetical protein